MCTRNQYAEEEEKKNKNYINFSSSSMSFAIELKLYWKTAIDTFIIIYMESILLISFTIDKCN